MLNCCHQNDFAKKSKLQKEQYLIGAVCTTCKLHSVLCGVRQVLQELPHLCHVAVPQQRKALADVVSDLQSATTTAFKGIAWVRTVHNALSHDMLLFI